MIGHLSYGPTIHKIDGNSWVFCVIDLEWRHILTVQGCQGIGVLFVWRSQGRSSCWERCWSVFLRRFHTPEPWEDPKSRSSLGFYNLHHGRIRVHNWGIYVILHYTMLYHTILYCIIPIGSSQGSGIGVYKSVRRRLATPMGANRQQKERRLILAPSGP